MSTAADGTEPDGQVPETVEFSMSGLRDGFLTCVPVALGVGGYGVVFGVVAREAGLSVGEAALMSATVLAGAAQLIAVELWKTDASAVAVLATTLVVNLRYVLMGAALQPWFERLSRLQAYGSVFFTADENWALTMKEFRNGSDSGAFLLGSGLAIWVFWVVATVLGATAGGIVGAPSTYGLDFVLTAIFVALLADLWEGTGDLLPWASAAIVAALGSVWLPGRWYILCGGIAASIVEVSRRE